ncbi:hypothetical protein, partial [Streptomyces sp. NPDC004830]
MGPGPRHPRARKPTASGPGPRHPRARKPTARRPRATARHGTHINAYDLDLYLRIAPELYLKRLCVGGMEKV